MVVPEIFQHLSVRRCAMCAGIKDKGVFDSNSIGDEGAFFSV